jgi:hypothetical protein
VWHVVKNTNEYLPNSTVANNEALRIDHVVNYANPFTTRTAFWFKHNYPGVELSARVDIFTISGKRIKTISKTINTSGSRSIELAWDGRDEWNSKIGRRVYLYYLLIKTPTGKTAGKWERLAILQ